MSTIPDEAELIAAVQQVLAENPEFGAKRIAATVKEANDWQVGEKRGTTLVYI